MAREIARGAVHLVRLAPNDKARPVVVLTRGSALRFLGRVTVAPVTTTIRGIPTEVALSEDDGMKQPCAVSLDNVVTIPRDLLGKFVVQLTDERVEEICRALAFAVGCLR